MSGKLFEDGLYACLSRALLIPIEELRLLITSAPKRYKVYSIPKRGGIGTRTIAQPARELKPLQYWLLKNLIGRFSIHSSVMAYTRKRGIRKNAERHSRNSFLLKMDFRDFFPSIKANDFEKYVAEWAAEQIREEDVTEASSILFWRPRGSEELSLSIGAPTSPALSNALMFGFDVETSDFCKAEKVSYTRYADDLTFSCQEPEPLRRVEEFVQGAVDQLPFPRLSLNQQKTLFVSKKFQRRVTGLVLANDGNVSLGRDRKRRIRSMVHHFVNGDLDHDATLHLHGLLAFVKDVEPAFLERLNNKYGSEFLTKLKAINREEMESGAK